MTKEDYIKRVIDVFDERGDFVSEVDGYIYFWPGNIKGSIINVAYTSADLRIIADELDKRNASWDKQLKEYFENESNGNPSSD